MAKKSERWNWVETADGSLSLWEPSLNEGYHNRKGAFIEACNLYAIPAQLDKRLEKKQELTLFDPCFGQGYNSWVSLEMIVSYAKNRQEPLTVTLHSCELDSTLVTTWLPVLSQLSLFSEISFIKDVVEKNSEKFSFNFDMKLNYGNLQLHWLHSWDDLREVVYKIPPRSVDLIFHDAFSPAKMPELWSKELFANYKVILSKEGRLLSYSVARMVRDNLEGAGWKYKRTSSAGRKNSALEAWIEND